MMKSARSSAPLLPRKLAIFVSAVTCLLMNTTEAFSSSMPTSTLTSPSRPALATRQKRRKNHNLPNKEVTTRQPQSLLFRNIYALSKRDIGFDPTSTSTTSTSSSTPSPIQISKSILQFYSQLDELYTRSTSIKCPFLRRRIADAIDGTAMTLQFLLIRHKSLPLLSDLFLDTGSTSASALESITATVTSTTPHRDDAPNPTTSPSWTTLLSAPGCKPLGRHILRHPNSSLSLKSTHLPLSDIASRIHRDWIGGTSGPNKGYYITGKLDSTIYRDDCLFTGPDPDMPVRGLRKYLSAAAQLFDSKKSHADLLSMAYREGGDGTNGTVEVTWKLGGVLMLPWHPEVQPWTGKTTYHLDEDGLIYWHEEEWDISVFRAFVCTLFPGVRGWFDRVGGWGVII